MNARISAREFSGYGWLDAPRSSVKLMLLDSSLPAQAASAIGNSTIARHLAEVDKGNTSSQTTHDSRPLSKRSDSKMKSCRRHDPGPHHCRRIDAGRLTDGSTRGDLPISSACC